MTDQNRNSLAVTESIVCAFVANNALPPGELPKFIADVHAAVAQLGQVPAEPPAIELQPAVPVRKSVTPDAIICLEDGKRFKSLKRHLRTAFNMTPDDYRTKWSLPADYPMVAPNYSATRSQLAKDNGLGRVDRARAN